MTTVNAPEAISAPAAGGSCPFAPPPAYERASEERPVTRATLWDGSPVWLVTRYDEVRAALRDPALSSDATRPGFPFLSASRRVLSTEDPSFIRMDGDEHARLRRMLTGEFIIKRVRELRPEIQRMADGFLDDLVEHGPPADLVAHYALPIPSLVICLLLGVPYEDHAFFQQHSHIALRTTSTEEEVRHSQTALIEYLEGLARQKLARPDDTIFGRLVSRGDLGPKDVARMGRLLLIAGHETTANMTAMSALALIRNPEQLAKLRARPERIGPAVEELLRYLTVVRSGLPRAAVADTVIGGQPVRAGEGVLCMLPTANRDPHTFGDPDQLDVDRDARRHIAFGFGVHQCLGQPLARLELAIAVETLIRRLPGLRLAVPFEELRFRDDMAVYGVHELPVAW